MTDESGLPYRTNTNGVGSGDRLVWNHSKFAFCAYPAQYGITGRYTFCVNEGNTIYKEDNGGRPRESWPPDDTLKPQYTAVD